MWKPQNRDGREGRSSLRPFSRGVGTAGPAGTLGGGRDHSRSRGTHPSLRRQGANAPRARAVPAGPGGRPNSRAQVPRGRDVLEKKHQPAQNPGTTRLPRTLDVRSLSEAKGTASTSRDTHTDPAGDKPAEPAPRKAGHPALSWVPESVCARAEQPPPPITAFLGGGAWGGALVGRLGWGLQTGPGATFARPVTLCTWEIMRVRARRGGGGEGFKDWWRLWR